MYPYGLIGNCQTSALIHSSGSIDWWCAPRPDSPPIFGKLLDPAGGEFSIESQGKCNYDQRYLLNTNILITTVTSPDGVFEITDFCPRFEQYGRMYRPVSLFRIVTPKSGKPVIRVRCRPVVGWEKEPVPARRGNSHLRYDLRGDTLRLTTTMPLTHLCEEIPVPLTETIYFGLTWSSSIEEDLTHVAIDFLDRTQRYWRTWVKHCSIAPQFQLETIRSALVMKLHCYEDTGAILAALSTSLPEEAGSNRNWDYRFCWMRDSYYTLSAFHRLGHFEEMEGFLKFLLGLVHSHEQLSPVYQIDGILPLPEHEHPNWAGYMNSQPVRSKNAAGTHVQNDVYGELILALAPIFFDDRFHHLRSLEHQQLLEKLAFYCAESISKPDAGLWELRNGWQAHSFTDLMCWAGLDRVEALQKIGRLPPFTFDVSAAKLRAQRAISSSAVKGSVRNGPTDDSFNAALLQLPILRYPDLELSTETVRQCYQALQLGESPEERPYLFRYIRNDDFGVPQSAFVLCSFWGIQALARIGERKRALEDLRTVLRTAPSSLGLFAEHFHPTQRVQLGNFPQVYSHVGLINAVFAVSPTWDEVL